MTNSALIFFAAATLGLIGAAHGAELPYKGYLPPFEFSPWDRTDGWPRRGIGVIPLARVVQEPPQFVQILNVGIMDQHSSFSGTVCVCDRYEDGTFHFGSTR
jgi:hypothetical protein